MEFDDCQFEVKSYKMTSRRFPGIPPSKKRLLGIIMVCYTFLGITRSLILKNLPTLWTFSFEVKILKNTLFICRNS